MSKKRPDFSINKMTKIKNIMTVDLEDYFCDLEPAKWSYYPSRIVDTTNVLLELFSKYKVTATFFTLGYIAEKFPGLIERIVSEGHEIASHGYAHLDIRKITKEKFESDLLRSITVLEKLSGDKVRGFRAPFFSVDETSFWALEIIRNNMKYDSSIFPIKTPLYGVSKGIRHIYKPSKQNPLVNDDSENLVEIPPATYYLPLLHSKIPIAGGFHLRFLPYWLLKHGIKKLNNENEAAVCYIHPKDLDPHMPKIREYKWYYYYGLKGALKKYEKLLQNFKFDSIRNTIQL